MEKFRKKPDPEPLEFVLDYLNVDKCDAVYIGDSEVDIRTAANAGMDCISVLWGFRDEDCLREEGGTEFVRSADELYDAIVK